MLYYLNNKKKISAWLVKNHKNLMHNEEKTQQNKSISEMIHMIEVVDRNVKIITMAFYMFKRLEKNLTCYVVT